MNGWFRTGDQGSIDEDGYVIMSGRLKEFINRGGENIRSRLPTVTHVDGSARPQTVGRSDQPRFWALLHRFGEISGIPVLLNTSFNVRGQPIICTPEEALDTFRDAGPDALVIGDILMLGEACGREEDSVDPVHAITYPIDQR